LRATFVDLGLRLGFAGTDATGQVVAHHLAGYGALPSLASADLGFICRGLLAECSAVRRAPVGVVLLPQR
jgi:hypothetical protein